MFAQVFVLCLMMQVVRSEGQTRRAVNTWKSEKTPLGGSDPPGAEEQPTTSRMGTLLVPPRVKVLKGKHARKCFQSRKRIASSKKNLFKTLFVKLKKMTSMEWRVNTRRRAEL